eukprot:5605847-Prymnesium_polylepis.1
MQLQMRGPGRFGQIAHTRHVGPMCNESLSGMRFDTAGPVTASVVQVQHRQPARYTVQSANGNAIRWAVWHRSGLPGVRNAPRTCSLVLAPGHLRRANRIPRAAAVISCAVALH